MPDNTNIESLQAQIRQRLVQDTRESAVRACLDVLAPDPGDVSRSSVELLQRLQTVITTALEELEPNA